MVLRSQCGCNISLIKAGVAVGLVDILSMACEIYLKWKNFSDDIAIIMISIGTFSIAITSAIIMIHGIIQRNKSLLIYWLTIAVVRIFLMSLFCGMILYIKPTEQFLFGMEIVGILILIYSFMLIWQLYYEMWGKDGETVHILKDEESAVN